MTVGAYPVGAVASGELVDYAPIGAPPQFVFPSSLGPGRLLESPAIMQPFGRIQVGEIDNFGFDLTHRVAYSAVISTQWFCRMTPFSGGIDLDPGSRVPSGFPPPQQIVWRCMYSGYLERRTGWFAVVPVGPMPVSAAGGTYVLGYTAYLADGRIITDSSTVECVLPGR